MVKKGPNLNVNFPIKRDSDGDNVVEETDEAVADTVLSIELCDTVTGGCNFQTSANTTDASGIANYKLLKATSDYRFEVFVINHDTYTYNTADNLDQNNPAFYT